jgi:hypothetical protein
MERAVVALLELVKHAAAVVLWRAGGQVGGVDVVHVQPGNQQVYRSSGEDGQGRKGLGAELAPGKPDHRASSVGCVVDRRTGSVARSM